MPSLNVRSGGVWKAVVQPYVRNGGVWKPLVNMFVRSGGVWKLVWTGFTTSLSPTTLTQSGPSYSSVTTGTCTVTVTGGVGPFTYAWTIVSGDPSFTPNSPTSASTTFTGTTTDPGVPTFATYKCVVTDTATGLTSDTSNTVFCEVIGL